MTTTKDVLASITRRVGGQPMSETSELTALGIDSLLLLRIITDLAADEDQEIEPHDLARLVTVGDLTEFVGRWNSGPRP
ncbi:acyl carrier protein [Streptomyces sp. NPDC001185]|uniref:acyl carrier protein n=1 Tax=Streptomyces sp. NPDC001185 TaxID=3154380 RepID=UPI00331ADBF5